MIMEILKADISRTGIAEIHCPNCNRLISKAVEDRRKTYRSQFSCPCGKQFMAEIEFRGKSRKYVDLPGTYHLSEPDNPSRAAAEKCRIIDISRQGIGILINDNPGLTKGNTIRITFTLDDRETTRIVQNCRIKHVKGNCVGCLMTEENHALDLYLLD